MGDITLRKALDDYKTIYMAYRNFAQRTRVEYQNDLVDFIEFAEKSGVDDASEVGIPIVERFIASLEHKGYSSLTRKRKVVTLRSFFSFLHSDGYIHANLASRIILPFTETTTPNVLTQTECDRLRAVCAGNPRDRGIIELLLQTGIKLSELTGLTLNDIDLDRSDRLGEKQLGFIRVPGKRGKKDRIIPLDEKATLALESYLRDRETKENNILFLNRFGEAVSDRGVQKMLRKYLKAAEIGRASIHTLRHTFGVRHIAKGTDLKTIQETLGFRDPKSMSIYVSLARELTNSQFENNALVPPEHIILDKINF